jgi:lysylphosphatidylglycerol synthetase-like protein (DUF2156 family)
MEEIIGNTDFSNLENTSRSDLVAMVRHWGGATTDAILDPITKIFTHPNTSGFIGYRLAGSCAVVFGDPICPNEDRILLTQSFHKFMKEQRKNIIYIAASQDFAKWAIENVCKGLIEFGVELTFKAPKDPRKGTGTHASLVRRKVKQAIREAITIEEYTTNDANLEQALEQVATLWLQSRKGPQLHISDVHLFEHRFGKRWFYAKQGDRAIGVIMLNQLESSSGWLMNHLMITPDAPNGTSEFLVSSVFESLEKKGCQLITVGMISSQTLGEIIGFGAFPTFLARTIFKIARKAVHLDGLGVFWEKFEPSSQPSYLLFSRTRLGVSELMGLKSALNK